MIVADNDTVTPTELALAANAQALDPKKLVLFDGGHHDPYVKCFGLASTAARAWFAQHLVSRSASVTGSQ